jgi:hypothetical protein
VARVLAFIVLTWAVGVAGDAVGLGSWIAHAVGVAGGLVGVYVLGDAGRLPDPFDEPARSDRPSVDARR